MNTHTGQRRWVRPCTVVYIVLIALTLVTWRVGTAEMSGSKVSLLVLGIALFKGHLIGDWFMGLRGLRSAWRWVVPVWLLVPGGLITWAFIRANGLS